MAKCPFRKTRTSERKYEDFCMVPKMLTFTTLRCLALDEFVCPLVGGKNGRDDEPLVEASALPKLAQAQAALTALVGRKDDLRLTGKMRSHFQ